MTRACTRLSRVFTASAIAALAAAAPAFAQGKTMAQDDWIQTSAIQWGGGVRVASGDVDGRPSAAPGGEHEFEYDVVVGKAPPPRGPGSVTAGGSAPATTAAGTKIAQFAINGNALGSCRVGTRYPMLRLFDGSARWQLGDVAVVRCGGGKMTVSYSSRTAR